MEKNKKCWRCKRTKSERIKNMDCYPNRDICHSCYFDMNKEIEKLKARLKFYHLLSDIPRKVPGSTNASASHYFPIYGFDVVARGMPLSFPPPEGRGIHERTWEDIKIFKKDSLGIIPTDRDLPITLNRQNTSMPIFSSEDQKRQLIRNAYRNGVLDVLMKLKETFDSHTEMRIGRENAAANSFNDYVREKDSINELISREGHR